MAKVSVVELVSDQKPRLAESCTYLTAADSVRPALR